jgi:UDP-N-acetyl-D-glucosamine dehydrogenase
MTLKQTLLDRFHARQAVVGIIGLGYVGLPLAVEFAAVGLRVIGFDVSASKVQQLNNGESYIPDIPTARLKPLVEQGLLRATTNPQDLRVCDAVSICVPTPLGKAKDPDMSYVIQSVQTIADICHDGMLVVLESTTYPGTTDELVVPALADRGFVAGQNVFIAFSPERIDPANPKYGVRNTPKVVGGVTEDCTEVAAAWYATAIDHVVSVSSPSVAELVKLLENTFRAVNIGLANELALMCDRLGVDVWEVIRGAATKPFGFMPFYPGPGIGGHCIPIDPLYLSWKMKTLNYTPRFIELANDINSAMPTHVLHKVMIALNDQGKALRGARVVVLGVAYKRDIDDVRESPALEVLHLLRHGGAQVVYTDPYVRQLRLEHGDHAVLHSTDYSTALLSEADCVVIITDHTNYDWQEVVDHSRLIVDTRNAIGKRTGHARVVGI